MGYKDVRVIAVTRGYGFYKSIQSAFSNSSTIETVMQIENLPEIEGKLNRLRTNVMILDLDDCSATLPYLRQLMERHKLLIILTASSPSTAMPYLVGNIKEFILKPRLVTDVYVNVFVNAALVKIQLFDSAHPTMNYLGMQKTIDTNQKIVLIASSTGGTEALEKILRALPADVPPILVVQHMPSGFTKFFANRLNNICAMEIREAINNDYLQKGLVLIAPADSHMKLIRRNSRLMVECFVGTKLHGVMPAADILFESVAPLMRSNAIGVILTGMGADGAKGLFLMHLNGAKTIGQNKETCVVYGMPKVAFDMGAVDVQKPLDKIAETIMSFL